MTSYLFRFTFSAPKSSVFPIPEASTSFRLPPDTQATLVARNAESIADATSLHIQVGGFPDMESARASGERLRLYLRVLNAALHLGLHVPLGDTVSSQAAEHVKAAANAKSGGVLVDSISGLNVFPDDGHHFEGSWSGHFSVFPSDPTYALKSLAELWKLDLSLDPRSEDALNLLGTASGEANPRTAFLTTYFALEILVDRLPRSHEAKLLLKTYEESITASSLPDDDKASLRGAIGSLHMEPYGAAFKRLAATIQTPAEISGYSIPNLLKSCQQVRNGIAHGTPLPANLDIGKLSSALRSMALMMIWSRCKLPPFATRIPASSVRADHFDFRVL